MKRLVLAAVVLVSGVIGAQADTDTWVNISRYTRSPGALYADAAYCSRTVGPNLNGLRTSPRYKRCMRTLGWQYSRTIRERPWANSQPLTPSRRIYRGAPYWT